MELAACIACSILFVTYTQIALAMARRPTRDKIIAALFGISFSGTWHAFLYIAFSTRNDTHVYVALGLWLVLTALVLWFVTDLAARPLCGLIMGDLVCVNVAIVWASVAPGSGIWPPVVVLALVWHAFVAASLFWWVYTVRRNQELVARCPRCDYDLLGLADSTTRCPECGADIRRNSAAHS